MEQLLNDARRAIGREPTRGPLSDWPLVVALVGALIGGLMALVALGRRIGRGQAQPAQRAGAAGRPAKRTSARAKSPAGRRRSGRSTTRRAATQRKGTGEGEDKAA